MDNKEEKQNQKEEQDKKLYKDNLYILFLKLKTNVQKEPILFKFEYLENNKYSIMDENQNFITLSTFENKLPKRINEVLENLFTNNTFIYEYYKKGIENQNTSTSKKKVLTGDYYIEGKKISPDIKDKTLTNQNNEPINTLLKKNIIKISSLNNTIDKKFLESNNYNLIKEKYNIVDYNWDKNINVSDLTINKSKQGLEIPDLFVFNVKEKDILKKKKNKIFNAIKSTLILEKDKRPEVLYGNKLVIDISTENISVYINNTNKVIYYVVKDNEPSSMNSIENVLKGLYNDYKLQNIDYNVSETNNKNRNIINIDGNKYYINKTVKYILGLNTPKNIIINLLTEEMLKPINERNNIKLPYDDITLEYEKNISEEYLGLYVSFDKQIYFIIRNKDKVSQKEYNDFKEKAYENSYITDDYVNSLDISKKEKDDYIKNWKATYKMGELYYSSKSKVTDSKPYVKYEINIDLLLNPKDISGTELNKFNCKFHKYELLRMLDNIKDKIKIENKNENLKGGYLENKNDSNIYKMPRKQTRRASKHMKKPKHTKRVVKHNKVKHTRRNKKVVKRHNKTMKKGGGFMNFVKKAQEKGQQAVQMAKQQGQQAVQMAQQQAQKASEVAKKAAVVAQQQGKQAVQMAQQQAQKVAQVAQQQGQQAVQMAQQQAQKAAQVAKQAAVVAKEQGQQAVQMAQQQAQKGIEVAKQQGQQAVQMAQQQAQKAQQMIQ